MNALFVESQVAPQASLHLASMFPSPACVHAAKRPREYSQPQCVRASCMESQETAIRSVERLCLGWQMTVKL